MMVTTHALAGMALVSVTALFAPEYTPVAMGGAVVGGVLPDLDLARTHRRTLHYPVYYAIGAVAATAVAVRFPSVLAVGFAAALASAALHSLMDAFGGGLEVKPWLGTSERAVYDHYHGRWIRPRRWIRYDGAPEDVAVAVALATPMVLLTDGPVRSVALVLLGLSILYGVVRKPLVAAAERLVATLPSTVLERLPFQFVEDLE